VYSAGDTALIIASYTAHHLNSCILMLWNQVI